jgi:CRISPR-associated protein Cmr4
MITDSRILYLYTETPLHAGVGSGLSSIDLPIQRERTTQYPMIQGSGIKGKLRAAMEGDRKELSNEMRIIVDTLFGPPAKPAEDEKQISGSDHAGALIFGDARILLFPVRSLSGVFAYTTCYDVLQRFKRDKTRSRTPLWKGLATKEGEDKETVGNVPKPPSVGADETPIALVTTDNQVSASGTIVLEEFSFTAQPDTQVDTIADWIATEALPTEYGYWHEKLKKSLVILPDNDFRDFVLYATEIITRISIKRETKTAAGTALWTEEHLPTDTLLYVPIYATNPRKNGSTLQQPKDILQKATSLGEQQSGYIQLGGDETVGRGLVRMHWEKEQ